MGVFVGGANVQLCGAGGAGDSSAQPPGGHHLRGSAQRGPPLRPHRSALRPRVDSVTSDLLEICVCWGRVD